MSNREAGGLFANGQRVPLKGVAIEVKAAGVAARVTVAQRYQNTEKVPVEAVYSFPLEESCAVCGFEVEIAGRRIVGKVEEREKAFEKYDDAMAQGHGAFLVDQDRPNIFTASVGNLLPDQEATVRLTYVTELEQAADSIRMLIPTTISPRYVPKDVAKKMDPSELDHITPPAVAGPVPYGLKLSVELEAATDVKEVSCPSHPARVSLSGRTVRVELMGENIQLDQDFVLNVTLAKAHEASAIVSRDGDGVRAVMLNLFPDLSQFRRGPAEFIFIIDRSGSMDGPSIAQARTALLVALRSLESGDRFNVIGFGTTFEAIFNESMAYSQATLDAATAKVSAMSADLGGTEMLAPLQHALESSPATEMPRIVLLLTDGQIGNEDACLALAKKHAPQSRIFTFGVGHGVSEHLLRGLSRSSGGQAEFIHPNERIEPKVLKQINRIASASISNVRIDWGGLKTDLVAPAEVPQLYNGDRFTVYARVIGGTTGDVAVLADSPKGALRFPVTVDMERATTDNAIGVLMARKAIQELEEGRGSARGSAQQDRKANATRARILELALRYQLISSATSFVAIEERVVNGQAQAELRRVPVALTKGWGEKDCVDTGAVMFSIQPGAAPAKSRGRAAMAPPGAPAPAQRSSPGIMASLAKAFGGSKKKAEAPPPSTPMDKELESLDFMPEADLDEVKFSIQMEDPKNDPLYILTLAQKADGSFDICEDVTAAARAEIHTLQLAARKLPLSEALAKLIVATLVALETFEIRFKNRIDEWRTTAQKAERWLSSQSVPVPDGFKDLREWIRSEVPIK